MGIMVEQTLQRSTKAMARVFVVEDHPLVRTGLTSLINRQQDLAVCGEAADAETALGSICSLEPDAVVVDISLPGKSGLELIRDIKARYPQLPVLVLSMHEETVYAERALRAGAAGYVLKSEASETVIGAIREVLRGRVYVNETISSALVRGFVGLGAKADMSPPERLTGRECEVFRALGRGFSSRQIADMLHLSVKTVEEYRERIKRKLALKDAAELRQCAVQWVQCEQGV